MKKIFIIAAAALALAACDNNEDNPVPSPVAAKVTATIGENVISRAVDQSWAVGDQIGISSTVGTTVGPYINVEYTAKDVDGNFEGTPLFFYKPMTLTAYYPFVGEEGKVPGVNGVIEANTRPANQTSDKQPLIDFLWDKQTGFTAQYPNVKFTFAHKMSKVTFTFQDSEAVIVNGITLADPVEVSDMVNYTIDGLVLDGTFDTATGVCAVKEGTRAENLSIGVNDVKDNEALSPLILFPQAIGKDGVTLHLYTDELNDPNNLQHYKCQLMFSDGEIKPGTHYKYTIKVTKIGLIVGKMEIESWVEANRYMTATIDGDKVFDEK